MIVNVISNFQPDEQTHIFLVSVILEMILKLCDVHEVRQTRREFWVLYPPCLQFQPEIRIDRQKQRINPPMHMPVRLYQCSDPNNLRACIKLSIPSNR